MEIAENTKRGKRCWERAETKENKTRTIKRENGTMNVLKPKRKSKQKTRIKYTKENGRGEKEGGIFERCKQKQESTKRKIGQNE